MVDKYGPRSNNFDNLQIDMFKLNTIIDDAQMMTLSLT